jgi:predicted  nucleic acid-binding Zn-ribbon protein
MKGNIYKKFEETIGRNNIDTTFKDFETIKQMLYLEGNIEDLVMEYCNYQNHIIQLHKSIKEIQTNINQLTSKLQSIKNRSVTQLRKEGKLGKWLMNLSTNELNVLKNIVDIDNEFKQIDEYRFNEEKKNRGRVVIQY